MPKRHRNLNTNRNSPGHNQDPGSSISPRKYRRALPALPGRAPQVGEAELLSGVTKASAEPLTGAIPSGPQYYSKTEGHSPQPTESDIGHYRLGRLTDGFSHLKSDPNNIPLRTNNNFKSLSQSAPSPSGDIPIEFNLANSGIDPTTNGLSIMEVDERQEGAKGRTTNSDTYNTPYLDHSLLFDNNMSHSSILFVDKTKTISTAFQKNIIISKNS